MARTILNLNKGGYLTMDETAQLYEDYDALVRGEDRPIIAGTISTKVENKALTRLAKGNKYDTKDPRNGSSEITNTTASQLLGNVSDSLKTSLLANQELRKEQKKAASRSGMGGSLLGGGRF